MGSVRGRAKRAVVGAASLAALPYVLLFGAVVSQVKHPLVGLVYGVAIAVTLLFFLPEKAIADRVLRSLMATSSRQHSTRLQNIADGLAIAVGVPQGHIAIIDSPIPNVLALPTTHHGLVVVATDGAVSLLSRAELEALVASQVVIAGNFWVRLATRAQLLQGPWVLVLVLSWPFGMLAHPAYFIAAFCLFPVFLFGSMHRRADEVRDLVADGVAINTTKNPDALVNAFRNLRPAASLAGFQKLGSVGMLVDPYAVISVRQKVANSLSVNGRTRSWSTEDELAMELGIRANRMERVSNSDFSALESLGPIRKAWAQLGVDDNPYGLTAAEREAGDALRASWKNRQWGVPPNS